MSPKRRNGIATRPSQGNVEAQFRLARIVAKGAKGLKQDLPTAVKLYQDAAGKGHAQAMNALGQLYQNGQGVRQTLPRRSNGIERRRRKKLAEAENNLGMMYLNGKGVTRNLNEAFKHFKAPPIRATAGVSTISAACTRWDGEFAADREKALDFYKQAAAKGNKAAGRKHWLAYRLPRR